MIEARNLSFGYRSRPVLDRVTLCVEPGARLAVLGANGSGKSTLAQWLAGWQGEGASSGHVHADGRPWRDWPLAERARAVQLVGQIPVQHLSGRAFTVWEEAAFGPENLALPVSEIKRRVDHALALCKLSHLSARDPFTLSGGEQRRLVLASALALEPRCLVLDEPLSNLDPEAREGVTAVLRALPAETALVVLETNPDIALSLASRFALLHEGRIAVEGSAREVLLHPLTVEAVGPPAVAQAYAELGLPGPLPLELADVARLPREALAC